MRLTFVDTGALYALVDRADPAHAAARKFFEEVETSFLTTDFVFAEVMSLVTKRVGKRVAVRFGGALRTSARLRIEEPSADMRDAAWELFSTQVDKDYDFIDCVSFAMMEAYGIRDAFAFDRHFAQRGFRVVPERGR